MEPYIGQIMMFGGNFAPQGWAFCNGQLLPIAEHDALFSILGTIYGGDGRTTFALPDLRGRAPIGIGHGPGLSNRILGEKAGAETKTLTIANMPSHNHSLLPIPVKASSQLATQQVPGTDGAYTLAAPTSNGRAAEGYNNRIPDVTLNTSDGSNPLTGASGGDRSFNIMDPFIAMNYVIALYGIYPSRG